MSFIHLSIAVLVFGVLGVCAQSTEQQFPTPVFANQISGEIKARALGDNRQTTYFYTFNGGQGDLFLNLVTNNLNADIDVFVEQGLRPLTKIAVYADRGETETGRVIYLRKQEKLLLRIQGRTPNDEPGRYQIKFAGGFIAAGSDVVIPPEPPRVVVRVDDPIVADRDEDEDKDKDVASQDKVRSEPVPSKKSAESIAPPVTTRPRPEPKANPMANFNLIVLFTDGSRMERPMTEVVRFQVNNGMLTIVNKGGGTSRYSMADVVKVSIE